MQAAVGCYFDFNSGQKLPLMRLLADVTVGEGESVTPNTKWEQTNNIYILKDNFCVLHVL